MAVSEAAPAKSSKIQTVKYSTMVETAIGTLNERQGSSTRAIIKFIQANFPVGSSSEIHIKKALKKGISANRIDQGKGIGLAGSFKLSQKTKDEAKEAAKIQRKKEQLAAKKAAMLDKENAPPANEGKAKKSKSKKTKEPSNSNKDKTSSKEKPTKQKSNKADHIKKTPSPKKLKAKRALKAGVSPKKSSSKTVKSLKASKTKSSPAKVKKTKDKNSTAKPNPKAKAATNKPKAKKTASKKKSSE